MPITAGSISVARRINTGDYSHKEAKAEIHYTIEGDEKPEVVGHEAGMFALIRVASVLATVVKMDKTPEVELEVGSTEEPEEPKKRHRRTKAEIEAEKVAEVVVPGPLMETTPADPTPASIEPSTTSSSEDTSVTQVEITDKELNNACNETMNRIKNKPAIEHLIFEFAGSGARVITIPQAQRTEFLSKLKAL